MADYFASIGCKRDELCSKRACEAYDTALSLASKIIPANPVGYLKISTDFAEFTLHKYGDSKEPWRILGLAVEWAKNEAAYEASTQLVNAIKEAEDKVKALKKQAYGT